MNIHPAIIAACIMGTILVSGLGKMNIIHHEEIPVQLIENQVVTYTSHSIFGDRIDIRMDSEIKEQETVRAIIKVLQEAKSSDTIVFHMAGYGGEVETVENIINNMHASKAYIITIVEAPVYSGHAYISASGDKIIMRPFTYMMFHTSSGYGTDCNLKREPGTQGKDDPGYDPNGLDRTVLNSEHCQVGLDAHLALTEKVLKSLTILTTDEYNKIITGHDVYITSEMFNTRYK